MLSASRKKEVARIVLRALDKAESIWDRLGPTMDEDIFARADDMGKAERVPSRIPGHKEVEAGKEQVGTFIALVADMRNSSQHLLCAIAGDRPSELKRVFYETSALLPALEQTIQYEGGSVTEYLGDGLLALFEVNEIDKKPAITAAYTAAANCLDDTRAVVNEALDGRYNLPPLDIGIGMALSKAAVSLVGIEGNSHDKLIGRCVYFATKLAVGKNEIFVDEQLRTAWPITKGGKLTFDKRHGRSSVGGYLINRESRD